MDEFDEAFNRAAALSDLDAGRELTGEPTPEIKSKFYRMRDLQTDLNNPVIQADEKRNIRAEIDALKRWFNSEDESASLRATEKSDSEIAKALNNATRHQLKNKNPKTILPLAQELYRRWFDMAPGTHKNTLIREYATTKPKTSKGDIASETYLGDVWQILRNVGLIQ